MSSGVRVIESEPVLDRLKRIFSRPVWIAAAVLAVALLVAGIVALVFVLAGSSSDSASDAIDYSKALIVSDDYDLYALELDSQRPPRLLLKTSRGIEAFDFYNKNTIYTSEARSRQLNSLFSTYKNLTQDRGWQPVAVAVDYVTGKVYVLDARGRKLDVYDPESTSFGIAASDLRQPVDIALDALRGLMFIVQKSDSILKGNMDGTSLDTLITSQSVTALCLDRQTPRLYWADADKILSSDYMGSDQRVVYCTPSIRSIGVSGNRLFWARPPDGSSHRNLWTCATVAGVCRDEDLLQLPFDYPNKLKVYAGEVPVSSNPCAEANGGCQHLCLLTAGSPARRSCACFLGYKLAPDSRSCELAREMLLYARGDLLRARVLDTERQAFSDAIVPIPIKPGVVLIDKPTIDFDYNYYTKTLAYSDDVSIVTTSLAKDGAFGVYTRHKCLKDVSFDWVTNDLYYVQDNCRTTENTSIVVLKPSEEGYYAKSLQAFVHANGHPRSLVVDPYTGSYFFAILRRGVASIYRSHGLKKTPFSKSDWSVNETGVTLDAKEGRLYWFSADLQLLHSAALENTESQPRSVNVSAILEPRSVAVYERHAYISNLTGIWRLDKLTGHGLVKIAPRYSGDEVIAGVKVYAEAVQSVNEDNPCAVKNGYCQQFCLRVPTYVTSGPNTVNVTDQLKKICLCEDNREIYNDGLTCV